MGGPGRARRRALGTQAVTDPGGELIYGRRPVAEAKRGRRRVRRVWTADELSDAELTELAGSADHQGVVAEVEPFPYADPAALLEGPEALVVALDQVQDPHNLGAVCRSAEAAGASGVVIPERRAAAVTGAVCKASAGAVEHLPIGRVRNLADWLVAAKGTDGLWVYGAEAGAAEPVQPGRPDRAADPCPRQRGEGHPAPGGRRLRRAGLDPGPGEDGVAQRLIRCGGGAVRGRPAARATLNRLS